MGACVVPQRNTLGFWTQDDDHNKKRLMDSERIKENKAGESHLAMPVQRVYCAVCRSDVKSLELRMIEEGEHKGMMMIGESDSKKKVCGGQVSR